MCVFQVSSDELEDINLSVKHEDMVHTDSSRNESPSDVTELSSSDLLSLKSDTVSLISETAVSCKVSIINTYTHTKTQCVLFILNHFPPLTK